MIAELKRALKLHHKTGTKHKNGSNNKQLINYERVIDSYQTTAKVTRLGVLNILVDSLSVKTQIFFSLLEGFQSYAMYHQWVIIKQINLL